MIFNLVEAAQEFLSEIVPASSHEPVSFLQGFKSLIIQVIWMLYTCIFLFIIFSR